MVRDNRHDSAYIFGAICPAKGAGAAVIMPAVNTEAMNEHLKELAIQVTPGSVAVVVCDGSGWHQRGKGLIVPENVRLLSLPPYSPELNPVEKVWDYLRQNKLCARGSTIPTASIQSVRATGRVPISKRIGITCSRSALQIGYAVRNSRGGSDLMEYLDGKLFPLPLERAVELDITDANGRLLDHGPTVITECLGVRPLFEGYVKADCVLSTGVAPDLMIQVTDDHLPQPKWLIGKKPDSIPPYTGRD